MVGAVRATATFAVGILRLIECYGAPILGHGRGLLRRRGEVI